MKIVSYLRVSTRQQGVSGLGLDAQRVAIDAYAVQRHATVIQTFTEIESGKVNARPELTKALHLAKVTNDLTVGIMALVAQQEREAISRRTIEALAAAKARGVCLGNPNGATALKRAAKGNAASLEAICNSADSHAKNLQPVIMALRAEGMTSLGAVAEALNVRGMLTPRGGRWHKSSVRNLLDRLSAHTVPTR